MQAATSRRKRRSSSILKVGGRSPSRNVFQDLNGRGPLNLQEGQGAPVKRDPEPKSRRPSRRVSFADTYQVKEFLTEKDAASLGLWENSQTEDPGQPQEEGLSASVESATSDKATISASGLDTLLNGPIKSPAAAPDVSVAAPEECEPPCVSPCVSSSEESATQQTRTFDPEAENTVPLVDSKSFLARLMGGAGSQGNGGSPDLSMSCSSHAFNNTIIFGQDPDVTSSLDMTCLDETFAPQDDVILSSDKSTTTARQEDHKGTIDAGSFLSKFMQQKPAQSEERPVSSGEHTVVFGPGDQDNNMDITVAFSTGQQTSGLEKEGETQRQVDVAEPFVSNEEKTTVFSNMEPDADMDFTTTISSISTSQETVPVQPILRTEVQKTEDKTTIFSNTGADMDFTTTINSMKTDQENGPQQPTSIAEKPIEDKTTVFGEVEAGADMEFTRVIDSDGAGEHLPVLGNSVQPQELAQDKTVVFGNVESGAEMEFTTTITSAELQEQVPGSMGPPIPQEATQDRTTVFADAELGGDMEFTAAVGSLKPDTDGVSSHPPPIHCEDTNLVGDMAACVSSLQTTGDHREVPSSCVSSLHRGCQPAGDSPEKTKILGINTQDGDMELTTVIPEQKVGDDSQPPAAANTEETRVFSTEDTGRMELTCQFDLTGNQKKPSKLNKLKRRLSEMAGETTRVFGGEDTAMMDLTVGIRSVVEPQISSGSDTASAQDRTKATGGEKTVLMDLTVGVGGILNTKRLSEKHDGDKTKVFGRENTARMDLTQDFGGILASASSLDGNNKLDPVRGEQEASMSVQQNYGSSKSLSEEDQSSGMIDFPRSTKEATDRTQVFGADDGGMEMTRCHTGMLSEDTNLLVSAKRRKTTAQGKRVSFGPSQTLVTAPVSLPTMTTLDTADRTRIFGSDITASMDVTSCTGGILGQTVPQVTREPPNRPLSSLTDLTSFQQLSKPRSSLPLLRSRTSLVSTARRASAANMAGPQPDKDSTASPQKEETPEPVATVPPEMAGLLETAATPPASDSDLAVKETHPKTTEADVVTSAVENRPPVPPLSIAPVTGDDRGDPGIISPEFDLQNEQLELVETTAEFLAAVCQESLILPPAKPPVTSHSDSTLPTDLSHANSTLLDVTCRSNSSSDRSALGATAMEGQDDMTLPQQGKLSVSQFLTYCNIVFQDQGKDRRSVMPLIKSDPPENLYEHLEILSSLLPQAHVYEWSCNKLQEHISSTRQLVKQQEERLDQNNPALFLEAQKMIQDGKLKEVDELKKDMESLRSCCKKQAKTEWHEWNCKMTGAIVESLKEEYADMKAGVEEVDASLQKIDRSLAALDDVEKDLEDAIANLEGVKLPSDEDIQRYKEQRAVLLQKEEELATSHQEQEHLKSTCSSLRQERESLELQVDQLQLQQRELGLPQEGEDGAAVEAREEQVRALNRLQGLVEWDLEELTDTQLRVTFLQKSLLLTVAYAGVKDECQKIADIRLESLLADEAAPWAHLCHHMVLGALDQSQLVHTYPTFPTQSKLLHRVSLLVSEARRLGDEVQDVILRHPFTTVDGTDLTMEFSSIEAHAKFLVTFSLTPGVYPNQVVKCTCTHKIGAISPSAVESALCAVPAGSQYLSRMVQSADELIQQHASSLR